MKVSDLLLKKLGDIQDQKVAVLLSGGSGSASVLFALIELGKKIHAYTFNLEGHESTDLKKAIELTNKYDIEFTSIPLPTDINTIKKDCVYLINDVGCQLKTDVEICFAFKNSLPLIQEKVLVTGLGDDNYFGLSKKAQIYYKNSIDLMDKNRIKMFEKLNVQHKLFEKMAESYGIKIVSPYQTEEMLNIFIGTSYEEINKPKQKQWILDTFPKYFSQEKCYHADLQKGDSKIADNFLQLLISDWNYKGYKRTDGIYNSIGRGELPLESESGLYD